MMDSQGNSNMQNPPITSSQLLMTRVTQGVMLGTVLAVPVALWAYTQAVPHPSGNGIDAAIAGAQAKAAAAKKAQQAKKAPARTAAARTAPVIPASQMHIRIDDGSSAKQN